MLRLILLIANFDANRLFERGADCVGLDFLSHLFWDKYLEFEERVEAPDRIFAILGRVIQIPMHQYARYIERYRQMAQLRPVTELAPPELLIQFRAEVDGPAQGIPPGMKSELELERDMRLRINAYHMEILTRTQTETTKRWTYEAEIKRPYFHVTELDEGQLANWRKYLDFEEAEGSYERITFLYERCLVTCAQYDEFWARYARWMSAQDGKEEEVRNIYQRACAIYVPIALPAIRLRYAYFEEMCGRVDVAKDIHYAILIPMPSHTETIASLANLFRRHDGLDAAVDVYRSMLEVPEISIPAKADIVGKWARLLWKIKGSPEEARQVFQQNQQFYSDSRSFWLAYLQFELDQPTSEKTESVQYQKIKLLVESIRMRATLPAATIRELVQVYMDYLLVRGTSGSATEYMALDREVNGPPSVLTAALKQQEIKDAKARSRQPSLTAMTPVDPYSYSMSNGSVPLA